MKTSLPIKHVDKGWGWEKWIVNCEEYSWHYHKLKDEVFYLQSGKMVVYYSVEDSLKEAEQVILNPGDNFHVFRGLRHRMLALEDSELFEFSTEHFDSDSYRLQKGD